MKKNIKKLLLLFLSFFSLICIIVLISFIKPKGETNKIHITLALTEDMHLPQRAIDIYMNNNPNIEVDIRKVPSSINKRLDLYERFLDSKNSDIDIYQTDVIGLGDLEDHMVNLYDYIDKKDTNKYLPSILNSYLFNNRLIAIPWFTDTSLLYYRKDLLDKYNLNVPDSWNRLERYAKIIMDAEQEKRNKKLWGYVWQGKNYEGLTCNVLEWIVSNGNGEIIDNKNNLIIDEDSIDLIDKISGWIGTISPPETIKMDEIDSYSVFANGNAIFMRNRAAFHAYPGNISNMEDNIGIGPLPSGNGESTGTLGGGALSISKYSKNPSIAIDLALYISSYKEQKKRALEYGILPTIKDLYIDEDLIKKMPWIKKVGYQLNTSLSRTSLLSQNDYKIISEVFSKYMHNIITKKINSKAAIDQLDLDLKKILTN